MMSRRRIFGKHFALSEAEQWLPRLRRLISKIHLALESVADEARLLHERVEHRGNGGGIDSRRYFSHDAEIDAALSEIQDAGIVIQDLARGLIDFPHLMEDREVFLCWELSDGDRIAWYHELRAGYAGRQPLPR